MVIGSIGLGYALPGAEPLKEDKGASETFLGMIEVGPDRFRSHIKFLPPRQLVGELVASVLGAATAMPMPQGYLVLASRANFPESKVLQALPHETGYGFACTTLKYPSLQRRIRLTSADLRLEFLRKWKQWAAAVAFDDWIANWDRHDGNLLIGGAGEVWLIDHSHCFVKLNWTPADLQPNAAVANQLCAQLCAAGYSEADRKLKLQESHAAVARFLALDPADAIVSARAENWLSVDEVEALRAFLVERPSSISTRISHALGIPELPLENRK